jgi:hypothetical protein
MATTTTSLGTANPTLLDIQKITDPNGKIMPVVQALQQRNTFIQSMVWQSGNLDTGHRVAAQNSLPAISWVRLNQGIQPSKMTTDTYDEGCGILEGLSSVDERVADINGNAAAYRAAADDSFLSSMANTLESAFFYESTAIRPERILGLSARLGLSTAKYGNQILKAGGSGGSVNTSIWLVGWGDRTVYGISPRGQATGLTMKDRGPQRDKDASGNIMYKYETQFRWNCGLCVEDYRYVVRICNIDTTQLAKGFATGADLVDLMIQAYYKIYDPNQVRLAWYCDRLTAAFLHRQAVNHTSNATLSIDPAPMIGSDGVFGKPVIRCLGAPIYISDAITNTEAVVS